MQVSRDGEYREIISKLCVTAPDPIKVVHTALEVYPPRTSPQNHKRCFRGSRLVSKTAELLECSASETNVSKPVFARCGVYRMSPKIFLNEVIQWLLLTRFVSL